MIKSISRKEEAEIPSFQNAEKAYRYFKSRYGEHFQFQKIEDAGDGQSYWTCHLVLDRNVYEAGMNALVQGKAVMGLEFLRSYQTVELMESGHIHIVH